MLTVVLPNYNHSRFLPEALRALLAQTRPAEEVIVIDDASTDDSVEIIEAFLPKFANARLVRNSKNLGVVRNMNIGLEIARGDLVVFVAADDVIYPHFFKHAVELLELFPAAAFASGRTDIIDVNGTRIGVAESAVPRDEMGYIEPREAARLLMADDSWFTGNVSIFRMEMLRAAGGFSEELSAFTDGFVTRLLAVTYGACYTPDVLGAWRRQSGGLAWSETENLKHMYGMAELVERRMYESGAPFLPGYPERWKRRYIFGAKRFILANRRRHAQSEGMKNYAVAILREVVTTAWLFVTLRPLDTVAVIRRWLRAKL